MSQRKEKRVPGIVGNRYRIVSKIGSGTYGTVYLGMDNKTGQKVAIKHMTEAAGSLEQLLKLREVRSLQKMSDNPCVVQLIDALYLPDSGSFLIMELMDCDLLAFLRHYAQSRTHVPEEVVARIMYRVFSALARLHQSGYFHRDMKPENILVNKDGVAKLCDFGLVRDMRSTSPLTSYIATRWYRSPEMLLEAQDYGPPVDMWAAGCIMLEVLQCRPIFEGKDNLETFQEVIEKVGGFDNKAVPISAATGGGGEWLQGEYLVRKNSKFSKIYEQARARFKKSNGSGLIGHIKRDLSSEAVNLIARLLTHDPSKRLTAAQALAHPFCARARAEDPQCAPSSHRPIPRFISSVMMQSVSPSGASKHSDTPPLIKNEAQTSSSLSPVARAANQKVLSNTAPTFCSNEYNNVTSTKPLPQISNFDNNNNNNLRKHLPPINPSAAGQRLPSLSASNPQIPPLNAERVEIRRRQLFDSSEMSSVLGNRLPPSHNVLSSNNNAVSNNRNDANTLSSIVFNQQQQQQSSNIKTRLAAGNINNSNNINSNALSSTARVTMQSPTSYYESYSLQTKKIGPSVDLDVIDSTIDAITKLESSTDLQSSFKNILQPAPQQTNHLPPLRVIPKLPPLKGSEVPQQSDFDFNFHQIQTPPVLPNTLSTGVMSGSGNQRGTQLLRGKDENSQENFGYKMLNEFSTSSMKSDRLRTFGAENGAKWSGSTAVSHRALKVLQRADAILGSKKVISNNNNNVNVVSSFGGGLPGIPMPVYSYAKK
eukprot:GDKJ01055598.1.p1 GENE.GDKJ01055598.1~~GDKJ01055598.1.p1  ORF type:complete len:765 (-),score=177.12 GDKJ01055598.1:320-2614(-)